MNYTNIQQNPVERLGLTRNTILMAQNFLRFSTRTEITEKEDAVQKKKKRVDVKTKSITSKYKEPFNVPTVLPRYGTNIFQGVIYQTLGKNLENGYINWYPFGNKRNSISLWFMSVWLNENEHQKLQIGMWVEFQVRQNQTVKYRYDERIAFDIKIIPPPIDYTWRQGVMTIPPSKMTTHGWIFDEKANEMIKISKKDFPKLLPIPHSYLLYRTNQSKKSTEETCKVIQFRQSTLHDKSYIKGLTLLTYTDEVVLCIPNYTDFISMKVRVLMEQYINALMNGHDGTVVVGVEQTGIIVGITMDRRLQCWIMEYLRSCLEKWIPRTELPHVTFVPIHDANGPIRNLYVIKITVQCPRYSTLENGYKDSTFSTSQIGTWVLVRRRGHLTIQEIGDN